ncbi:cadherin-like domain-containing protein [Breoghania sp.]|uniref:cadherin-like domain-containing protein n=1 Tax=Breoghania sp. TaxID=2065378 RepID=UPI00261AA462|nr:cadherin-like domain-containing protein [Breoghania sp.]MDJ0929810.1 cadherin-like domain-containing protein [Breoghania sp.]
MPVGSDGTDAYYGGGGDDTLDGQGGDDLLLGGAGADTLYGGEGDDYLADGAGDDLIFGGTGDDMILWNVGDGHDTIDGGADTDTFFATGDATTETYDIYSNSAANLAFGCGGSAEIIIVRNGSIIAEMDGIEEIVIDDQGAPSDFSDTFNVHGSFAGTSLATSTITIEGGSGSDTVDISGLSSVHRIVFSTNGGDDVVLGALRGNDLINLAPGTTIEDYSLVDNGDGIYTLQASDHSVTFSGAGEIPMFSDDNGDVGNLPPAANAGGVYEVDEDRVLTVSAAEGVLANDEDLDGDSLSVGVVTGPAHGNLTLNADGSFEYTPDADYNGSDSFEYEVSEGNGWSERATVSLTVNSVDEPVVQGADKLLDPNGSTLDRFGESVATGDYGAVVVGSASDDEGFADAGFVFVFVPDGAGGYEDPIKLSSPAPEEYEEFGSSVTIGVNGTIVVGAIGDNVAIPGLPTCTCRMALAGTMFR